ncbi:unnamed protein product [Spirodela intermedia]|uniref:non-specific serine/threonine protein kinase n=1 Tax=Spirodela intermedia TaxID=51605 RepID=A0ABN7EBU8_SPIIN|nr:unnamed protein product [Spirodela intermedia]
MERNCGSTKGSRRTESLESGKTSLSRRSDSSGLSDDSNWSNFTGSANKPHKGNDLRWKAILAVRSRDGILGMGHFRLLKRLGCGDIGSVYLQSHGQGFPCKQEETDEGSYREGDSSAAGSPFLPTLYTHFETDRFTCLVMEFCPGGDLHTLRQRQPGKHFSEYAARCGALGSGISPHAGVVYRDLKPENVLVRDDGHIMLSDFDLSLRCAVSPTLIRTSALASDPAKQTSGAFCVQPACMEPSSSACIRPACFMPKLFSPNKNSKGGRRRRPRAEQSEGRHSATLLELVAEPTAARSMSFVGTHEYLAPEIIKGEGHGSAVDWWTFGIFLHELLYGKTPFKGSSNRATLFNVLGSSSDSQRAQHRLGMKRGATEIKQHPFFEGVNWALIRCSTPPEIPRPAEMELPGRLVLAGAADAAAAAGSSSKRMAGGDAKPGGKYLDFEFF